MSRPPKPYLVLKNEKKSHRTKKELSLREKGEKSLATGVNLKERPNVKSNPLAHKEFRRVNDLLKKIEKNDAIYEPVINRFCLIQAECTDLENRREEFYLLVKELKETFLTIKDEFEDPLEKAETLIEFTREIGKLTSAMMNIDKVLQTKRKMLLEIEKENVMTIASALRNIPKKEENNKNALLEALNDA